MIMQNPNIKEPSESSMDCKGLIGSPYVGGNKMSSSLKERLKRSRMYASPLSRPASSASATVSVAPRSIKFESFVDPKFNEYDCSYSKEDIEKAMNEPEPEINDEASSISKEGIEICMDKSDLELNENSLYSNIDIEHCLDKHDHKINEIASTYSKENVKNSEEKPDPEINENKNCVNMPDLMANEKKFSYSKEDIENCSEKQKLQEIFLNLQKEAAEKEEVLRKLKLVQKHHNKNSPADLTALTEKWRVCSQLALRKLYDFMPQPQSISFENFLIFLDVDFDSVKYNPETDTFS